MNIGEMIMRKKQEFFLAKDDKGLQAQRAQLESQRKKMEERLKLETSVQDEQRRIKEIRKENGPAAKFGKVMAKFKAANQEANMRAEANRARMGIGQATGPFSNAGDPGGPFFSKDNLQKTGPGPFAGKQIAGEGPFNKPEPAPKASSPRSITIKLRD